MQPQTDDDDSEKNVEFAGGNVHLIATKESWDQKLAEASRDGKIVSFPSLFVFLQEWWIMWNDVWSFIVFYFMSVCRSDFKFSPWIMHYYIHEFGETVFQGSILKPWPFPSQESSNQMQASSLHCLVYCSWYWWQRNNGYGLKCATIQDFSGGAYQCDTLDKKSPI